MDLKSAVAAEDTAFDWSEDVVQESARRSRLYEDRLARVERFQPSPRVWLDVGCGGGGMLKVASDAGYSVEGIEPSPSAEVICSRIGIPVHQKALTESSEILQFRQYGVISLFHVLEHILSPAEELLAAREFLSNEGILVIEVPFFDTPPWKILRTKHRHFYRLHRSYFNIRSLSELLQRTGYSVVKWEKVPYYVTMDWLLMRLGMAGGVSMDRFRSLLPRVLSNRCIRIDLGDVLFATARRT